MPYLKWILLSILLSSCLALQSNDPPIDNADKIEVYLFLGEKCRICQFYTPLLNRLYTDFESEQISIKAVFPCSYTTEEGVSQFQSDYQVKYPMTMDADQRLMQKFGIKVTPEVIVFNASEELVIYKGRIDNSYFKVGKRRTVTTTQELEDVLKSVQKGEVRKVFDEAIAVGCFIQINN